MGNMVVLFFLALPIAVILLRRTSQKQSANLTLGLVLISLALIVSGCDKATLTLDADTFETNDVGLAVLKGKVSDQAELTIDGQAVPNDKGAFSYELQLTDDAAQKVIVTTQYKKEKLSKTVTVKASTSFVKHLAKEEQRLATEAKEKVEKEKIAKEKATAETAIALAEKTPNQENYDKAFTLTKALTDQNKDFSERLEKVKQTVQLAAAKAEKTKEAELAVATAEGQPTKPHYETAKLAIAAIPGGADQLTKRLDTVNTTIVAAEETARQVQAQAAADAEATRLAETGGNQAGPVTTEMVLVTPTGAKYHNRKCGNGTYTEATMEQALGRGLAPCSKCF